jgi:uncharacterized protein
LRELHSLRDAIFDFIQLNDLEWRLLNSPSLQRLRFISQLGLARLVFPGAEHSKFSHLLGRLAVTSRLMDCLREDLYRSSVNFDFGVLRQLARLLALIAEIHARPFGYSQGVEAETILGSLQQVEPIFIGRDEAALFKLMFEVTGKHTTNLNWMFDLVCRGPLSASKMDSLLRDSRFCGVSYGAYDIDRLSESLALVEVDEAGLSLGVKMDGVSSLEGFVLADYLMDEQVYSYSKVSSFRLHYHRWLDETIISNAQKIDMNSSDDYAIWSSLRNSQNRHAKAIVSRNIYPLACEISTGDPAVQSDVFDVLEREIELGHIFVDLHEFSAAREVAGLWLSGEGGSFAPVRDFSPVISGIPPRKRLRIFSSPGLEQSIVNIARERGW